MTKAERIREMRLAEIEGEFLLLLRSCLRICAQGRYGLFGQNDLADPDGRYFGWPEAKRLKGLALEIKSIRLESGQKNESCERFLQLCLLQGPNVPGEPRLATEFLAEIDREIDAARLSEERRFAAMVEEGLEESRNGQTVSDEEVCRMVKEWELKGR